MHSVWMDTQYWEDKFWAKVSPIDMLCNDGCWEWLGGKTRGGYGSFASPEATCRAHRIAYELRKGPIPLGMYVCHRCDNPGCVNPAHLFVGTASDNTRDSMKKGRFHIPVSERKTHCIHGHEFTPENVRIRDGKRKCRVCHNISKKAAKLAKYQKNMAAGLTCKGEIRKRRPKRRKEES